ncbi:MAG: hypothetical protein ACFFGZ_15825 [Candidatus Thorarchaeota archaeon]
MSDAKRQMLPVQAVFIAGVTATGPGIIDLYPKIYLSDRERQEVYHKSMPMGGKDGDSISTSIGNYQLVCIINSVPSFEVLHVEPETFISFGLLIPKGVNPLPYREILQKVTEAFKAENLLNIDTFKGIKEEIFSTMNAATSCNLSISVIDDVKVEIQLDAHFETMLENMQRSSAVGTVGEQELYYVGTLTTEQAMEREKKAFVLDKTVLKAVCAKGPLSLEDIRRETLPLESVLGIRIDLVKIQEILKNYIRQGLISTTKKK